MKVMVIEIILKMMWKYKEDCISTYITMFDVSVDQFIHADGGARSSSCRKHIDVLLNSMNEKILFFPRLL